MTARTESEVKLELPVAAAPLVKKLPLLRGTPPKRKAELSVYLDTPKHTIRKRGLMLRVRHSDGCYVQTIKATKNADIFARDEWECEIAGPKPDLRRASGTALAPLLGSKFRRQLKPIFETRVRRTYYPLVRGACAVALTLDRGSIETGNSSLPLCEVEVELERGSEADLFAIAREITRALPAERAGHPRGMPRCRVRCVPAFHGPAGPGPPWLLPCADPWPARRPCSAVGRDTSRPPRSSHARDWP